MSKCENCIHDKVCLHQANIQTDTYAYMGVNYDTENCTHYKDKSLFVEVVRCKDCFWWLNNEFCQCHNRTVYNGWFYCDSGHRKETKGD